MIHQQYKKNSIIDSIRSTRKDLDLMAKENEGKTSQYKYLMASQCQTESLRWIERNSQHE
jgi:hypothetical protein